MKNMYQKKVETKEHSEVVIKFIQENLLKIFAVIMMLSVQILVLGVLGTILSTACMYLTYILFIQSKITKDDKLDKLYSSKYFQKDLEKYMASNKDKTLLIVDIDDFKRVNDTYGHDKGDEILYGIQGVIHQNIRSSDRAYRYGGEELAIILNCDTRQAIVIGERLRKSVEETAISGINVTVSIGLSKLNRNQEAFLTADKNLYRAKRTGKNRLVY